MDGLECIEINYKELFTDSKIFRFDNTFYSKQIIKYMEKICSREHYCFDKCIDVLTDYTANGAFADLAHNVKVSDSIDFAKWIRIQNLDRADYQNAIRYVTKDSYEYLAKSKLFGGELLISKTGEYLGKAFLFKPDEEGNFTLADNIFLVRLQENYSKELIYTYINSHIGRVLLLRWSQGTGQPTVIKDSLRQLIIPRFSDEFIKIIEILISDKDDCLRKSKEIYKKVEDELKEKFSYREKQSIYTIKNYSSISEEMRLDAEYYQPKYDDLFDGLKRHNTRHLGGENGLVNVKKSIEPGSEAYQDEGIPFVRVSDVDKFEISNPDIKISKNIVSSIETLYPKKDTILFSKDGSIGIAYKVQEDLEVVTSGALLHLTVKDTNEILPDYLTLVLNSSVVQLQAERDCNGAIIQHWKPSDIEKVIIPVLDMDEQKEIAEKVQESFRLRKKSKELLDIAVKAVEMAIETDEDSALLWLEIQKL